jgi:transcriptional regulator with XRE-family HTH domain
VTKTGVGVVYQNPTSKRENLKPAEFASKCGLSKQVLSNYLNGTHQPGVEKLSRIANEFDVDINFFFSGIKND